MLERAFPLRAKRLPLVLSEQRYEFEFNRLERRKVKEKNLFLLIPRIGIDYEKDLERTYLYKGKSKKSSIRS